MERRRLENPRMNFRSKLRRQYLRDEFDTESDSMVSGVNGA